jgi:hypothetical protein
MNEGRPIYQVVPDVAGGRVLLAVDGNAVTGRLALPSRAAAEDLLAVLKVVLATWPAGLPEIG